MKYCSRCKQDKPKINFSPGHRYCRSCQTKYKREWNLKNPEKRQIAQEKIDLKGHRLRQQVLHALGDVCIKCKFSDFRALQIDHINGGGRKEQASKSRVRFYRDILDNLSNYQLLCANCNWIKRYENKEAPQPRKERTYDTRI